MNAKIMAAVALIIINGILLGNIIICRIQIKAMKEKEGENNV